MMDKHVGHIHHEMREHGHKGAIHYHTGIIRVERNAHKEPHDHKSSLALHTNHNPGMEYSDEVMR